MKFFGGPFVRASREENFPTSTMIVCKIPCNVDCIHVKVFGNHLVTHTNKKFKPKWNVFGKC